MLKMSPVPVSGAKAGHRRGLDLCQLLRRLDAVGPARFATVIVLIYVVLATFAYLPAWPGDPHRLVGCACGDPAQQAWYLGWVPWAMLHGHNPLFTTWMEYPTGVNLAANTEMPLLGLLTAPVKMCIRDSLEPEHVGAAVAVSSRGVGVGEVRLELGDALVTARTGHKGKGRRRQCRRSGRVGKRRRPAERLAAPRAGVRAADGEIACLLYTSRCV